MVELDRLKLCEAALFVGRRIGERFGSNLRSWKLERIKYAEKIEKLQKNK